MEDTNIIYSYVLKIYITNPLTNDLYSRVINDNKKDGVRGGRVRGSFLLFIVKLRDLVPNRLIVGHPVEVE